MFFSVFAPAKEIMRLGQFAVWTGPSLFRPALTVTGDDLTVESQMFKAAQEAAFMAQAR